MRHVTSGFLGRCDETLRIRRDGRWHFPTIDARLFQSLTLLLAVSEEVLLDVEVESAPPEGLGTAVSDLRNLVYDTLSTVSRQAPPASAPSAG